MDNTKKIEVSLKHLYWYLIETCRYGYTRNNHLMPSGAFDTCREFLPKIAEADSEYAVYIAKQLCEECISDELVTHFYDGIDDEHHTRAEAIKFIEYCLDFIHETDSSYKPYNYELYLENLKRDDDKIYDIYEILTDGAHKPVTKDPVSIKDYLSVMMNYAGVAKGQTASYYKFDKPELNQIEYKIVSPVHKTFVVQRNTIYKRNGVQ